MNAYNYETQTWVSGTEARNERLNQLKTELEILSGPRGQEYLRFTGASVSLAEAIKHCRSEIAKLA